MEVVQFFPQFLFRIHIEIEIPPLPIEVRHSREQFQVSTCLLSLLSRVRCVATRAVNSGEKPTTDPAGNGEGITKVIADFAPSETERVFSLMFVVSPPRPLAKVV